MGHTALSPSASLLERHLEDCGDDLLVINPSPDPWLQTMAARCTRLVVLSQDYSDYRHLKHLHQAHTEVVGAASLAANANSFDHAIIFLAKGKALTRMLIHLACERVKPSGRVWLVGHNKAGIKSSGRLMSEWLSSVVKLDAARHCALFQGQREHAPAPFDLSAYQSEIEAQTPAGPLTLSYLPGVFARDRLDPGSELLLQHLPALSGRILDFGCGAGVLGLYAKKTNPGVEIVAADHSMLALHSAEQSFVRHQLAVETLPCDGPIGISGNFEAMITNPPFHRGIEVNYSPTRALLAAAPQLLRKGGPLYLVANAFINYAHPLQQAFKHCRVIADDGKYRVYRAIC